MKIRVTSVLLALAAVGGAAAAQPVLMSPEWAQAACEAWNRDAVLTDKLVESGWVKNDKGRGYKVMQVFRTDCGASPTAEMRIALKDGKAQCVYGGKVETVQLDGGADYVMSATTARWLEMGRGEYGPMRAMMFGRLCSAGSSSAARRWRRWATWDRSRTSCCWSARCRAARRPARRRERRLCRSFRCPDRTQPRAPASDGLKPSLAGAVEPCAKRRFKVRNRSAAGCCEPSRTRLKNLPVRRRAVDDQEGLSP